MFHKGTCIPRISVKMNQLSTWTTHAPLNRKVLGRPLRDRSLKIFFALLFNALHFVSPPPSSPMGEKGLYNKGHGNDPLGQPQERIFSVIHPQLPPPSGFP